MLGVKPVTLLLPGLGLDVVTPTLRAIASFCDQIFITSRAPPNKTTSLLLVVLEKQDIETEMIQLSGQKVLRFLICQVKNNTLSDIRL